MTISLLPICLAPLDLSIYAFASSIRYPIVRLNNPTISNTIWLAGGGASSFKVNASQLLHKMHLSTSGLDTMHKAQQRAHAKCHWERLSFSLEVGSREAGGGGGLGTMDSSFTSKTCHNRNQSLYLLGSSAICKRLLTLPQINLPLPHFSSTLSPTPLPYHNMTQVHLHQCPCHIASIRRQSASILTKRQSMERVWVREGEKIKRKPHKIIYARVGSNFFPSSAEADRGWRKYLFKYITANVVKCRPVHLHTL